METDKYGEQVGLVGCTYADGQSRLFCAGTTAFGHELCFVSDLWEGLERPGFKSPDDLTYPLQALGLRSCNEHGDISEQVDHLPRERVSQDRSIDQRNRAVKVCQSLTEGTR